MALVTGLGLRAYSRLGAVKGVCHSEARSIRFSGAPGINQLDWIAGSWSGSTRNGGQYEEHWMTPAGNAMPGMSRTISDGKTRSFEFLRIEERPEGIFYVAHVNGKPREDFKLTTGTPDQAVFEDPARDFPKRIIYKRTPDGIHATVEGTHEGKPLVLDYPMKAGKLK